MEMKLIRAGMHATVQDFGRRGCLDIGVPRGGAADEFALRVGNLLVGNPEGSAAIECTLDGIEFEVSAPAVVAVTGATFEGVAGWRPIAIGPGERVRLGRMTSGCRGCVAVSGGIGGPVLLGSRSTYERGGFGRRLRDGDVLPVGQAPERIADASGDRRVRAEQDSTPTRQATVGNAHWEIDRRIFPTYAPDAVLRVVGGAQASEFSNDWTSTRFAVTPRSDRMGLQLGGPALVRRSKEDLPSQPVVPGTIQVPPDGQPILLLADAQTIGGYPRLAHVIGADLPIAAQLRAGDGVRFQVVTLDQAHVIWRAREHAIAILAQGLAQKRAARSR